MYVRFYTLSKHGLVYTKIMKPNYKELRKQIADLKAFEAKGTLDLTEDESADRAELLQTVYELLQDVDPDYSLFTLVQSL